MRPGPGAGADAVDHDGTLDPTTPSTCQTAPPTQGGDGTTPATGPDEEHLVNPIAAQVGYWAGNIADIAGFVPGFLCGPCAVIGAALGFISGIAYLAGLSQ